MLLFLALLYHIDDLALHIFFCGFPFMTFLSCASISSCRTTIFTTLMVMFRFRRACSPTNLYPLALRSMWKKLLIFFRLAGMPSASHDGHSYVRSPSVCDSQYVFPVLWDSAWGYCMILKPSRSCSPAAVLPPRDLFDIAFRFSLDCSTCLGDRGGSPQG